MNDPNLITIEDDLDLAKIAVSGQCFRVRRFDDGTYRFITGDHVLYIRRIDDEPSDGCDRPARYEVSCTPEEWKNIWCHYFDLDRDYAAIRKRCSGKNDFIDSTMDFGRGIRVLNQDPWEMLITFIISQRKNMPAISKSVNLIAERFGTPIETEFETIHAFPTPEQLAKAKDEDLRECSLGYRAPYVADATKRVLLGDLDLDAVAAFADEELFEELQKVHGVGRKVANCICLFAYGRTSLVPVDVWIARAIDEQCEGEDPFSAFGKDAGIMQQYVFFYMTNSA